MISLYYAFAFVNHPLLNSPPVTQVLRGPWDPQRRELSLPRGDGIEQEGQRRECN